MMQSYEGMLSFTLHPNDFIFHEQWRQQDPTGHGNNIALVRLPENVITCNENPNSSIFPFPLDWNLGITFCLKHFTTVFNVLLFSTFVLILKQTNKIFLDYFQNFYRSRHLRSLKIQNKL